MNLSYVAELPTVGSNLNHRVKVKDLGRILIGDLNLNRGPGSKLPNPANKLIRFFFQGDIYKYNLYITCDRFWTFWGNQQTSHQRSIVFFVFVVILILVWPIGKSL